MLLEVLALRAIGAERAVDHCLREAAASAGVADADAGLPLLILSGILSRFWVFWFLLVWRFSVFLEVLKFREFGGQHLPPTKTYVVGERDEGGAEMSDGVGVGVDVVAVVGGL